MNKEQCPDKPMLNSVQSTSKRHQYLATISACMGTFTAGTILSWTSPALPYILLDKNATMPESPGFRINEQEAALLSSIINIGALIAAIPTGYFADKFGRKKLIIILTLPFILSWFLIIIASNVHFIVIARFLAGISVGGICVVGPMYIGEIAEASYRGIFGSYFELFFCIGCAFTCIVSSFCAWTGLSLILASISVIFLISFIFMPESPMYLVKTNDIDGARRVLKKLRGRKYDVTDELEEIQEEIDKLNRNKASLSDIVKSKGNIRALISVVGVMSFQQFSGINAVIFYAEPLFRSTNSSISPSLMAIIMNLVPVVTTYFSSLIIERADRRVYLMFSSIGMSVGLVSLGIYFRMKKTREINMDLIPLFSVICYMVCFAMGYGPIVWLLMSELFPSNIKGIATGIAVLTNCLMAFLVTYAFPLICTSYGEDVAFYIIVFFLIIATGFVYFVVPETRGKTLMEIQELLNK